MVMQPAQAEQPTRAFLALPLPLSTRIMLKKIMLDLASQDGDRRVRWMREENLHLTLRFFGDIQLAALESISNDLAPQIATQIVPFTLQFTNLTFFPGPRHPRVLAVQVQATPELLALAQLVEKVVVAHGLAAEERQFRPHVTLARMTTPRVPRWVLPDPVQIKEFITYHCAMYENQLVTGHQQYKALREFPFRN